jgi:hypothetical protein
MISFRDIVIVKEKLNLNVKRTISIINIELKKDCFNLKTQAKVLVFDIHILNRIK